MIVARRTSQHLKQQTWPCFVAGGDRHRHDDVDDVGTKTSLTSISPELLPLVVSVVGTAPLSLQDTEQDDNEQCEGER